MKFIAVESSMIAALGWSPASGLVVQFQNGSYYHYDTVRDPATVALILYADSVGKEFNARVKSVHPYKQVSSEQAFALA